MKLKVKDITLISILTVILIVQEQILNFLPNISLTVFLMVLYSKKLGMFRTSIIIILYCLLDNLIMSSLNIVYTPFMLIGWLLIPILLNAVFKKVNNVLILSLLGIVFSFLYCWINIIPAIIVLRINFVVYFMNDLMFEILLAISSFISIYLLYEPCSKTIDKLLVKEL